MALLYDYMNFMDKLVKRTYRISKRDDNFVKKNKKKFGGESAYIRRLIRDEIILGIKKL